MNSIYRILGVITAVILLNGCNSTGGTSVDAASTSNELVSNHPPVISGTPANSVSVGQAYRFVATASDADNDTLTFSISNLPSWATFSTTDGMLQGSPLSGDLGNYNNIVISVTDGNSTVSLPSFGISVTDSVQTGSVVGFDNTVLSVNEGGVVTATVTRSNSVGTATVMYGTHGITAVSSTLNGDDYAGFDPVELNFADGETTKTISVQTLDNTLQESTETFEIYLSSPSGGLELSASSVAVVSIVDNDGGVVNQAPTIGGTPSANATVGSAYSFTPSASDPDGDSLSFSIVNAPSWVIFDNATGTITGSPTSSDLGSYPDILISVTDGTASASLPAFTINVAETDHFPVAQPDSATVDQNGSTAINLLSNDSGLEDGLASLTVISNSTHGTLQVNSDNTISYVPDANFYGSDSFTYQIADTDGDTDNALVSITVNCVVNCSVITPTNTFYVREGSSGNNDGSDWSNAFVQLPNVLVRGATYLVADGTYPTYSFNDPESGQEKITIKKATVADHGINTGWLDGYGDGQAVFGQLSFSNGYYDFDGAVDYGFKALGQYQGYVVSVQADNVQIIHTDVDGNFQMTNGYQTNGACTGLTITGADVTVNSSDVHNIADDGVTVYDSNTVNILQSKVHNLHGCGTDNSCGPCYNGHSDGFELNNTANLTLSRNLIYDIKSTSAFFTGNWSPTYLTNLTLTNNIFYTPETGLTVYLQYIHGANVYNNVIWGRTQGTRYGGLSIGPEVTGLDLKNNIILSVNFSHTGGSYNAAEHDMDYNVYGTLDSSEYTPNTHELVGDPSFANIPMSSDINLHILDGVQISDFMLNRNSMAIDHGMDLTGVVDQDILGNSRPQDGNGDGSALWDAGALEVSP